MDGDTGSGYLNVRETARRLGVHENTVRNWTRDGVLKSAKLPGSRFHRYDVRDVERLLRQRGAPVASVGDERRTIGPELVDATQLNHWAGTEDARGAFPELMRRLIASTPGLTDISIRAHEGISAPGWDGRAESEGSSYLPKGTLCFEFGVGANPGVKAKEDYRKRRDDPLGQTPGDTVFVFATPRRWAGADAWVAERKADGFFADVKVVDADDLEGWLLQTPAVHQWISEHLGRRPRDVETLERWWSRFSARTDPALPSTLFLAGRDGEQERLTQSLLADRPVVVAVESTMRDDAIAFTYATVEATIREGHRPKPHLLVSTEEVWNRVAVQPGRMTLLPLFDDADLTLAQKHGHHVVLPLGWNQIVRGDHISLPRPHRQGAAAALEEAGVDSERADRLAALARRSMPSLIRTLAKDPRFTRPAWSEPPDQSILAPLVLVGAWTSSEPDALAVGRVVDQPKSAIDRALQHWRKTDDPPFVRPGSEWHLASAEEAFLVLGDALTPGDLERWREVAVDVLLEKDPHVELAPEEQPLASLRGQTRLHSPTLRAGLARGVALLGWGDVKEMSDGLTAGHHARRLVRQLLARANADMTGSTWRSLADELRPLAEAAPDAFLEAVHADLDRDEPLLRTMFQDRDQESWLFGSSPHTGLLWALELLCWSPELLLEATRALARLAAVDPGGRLSNRPLESLSSVLVGWIRQTSAPLNVRKQAVTQIRWQLPDIGWRLVLALWPTNHGATSPPMSPRYRDWKPETPAMPVAEWIDFIEHLVGLAIELADDDAKRWGELAGRLGTLPPDARRRLLGAIEGYADPGSLTAEDRLRVWDALNQEVLRHRRFPSADWSMDDEPLVRMEAIAARLEPTSDVGRFGYLFDWRPNLPDASLGDDSYDSRLLARRTQAVEETIATASVDGLRSLAHRSRAPSRLGWTIAAVADDSLTPELLTWLDSEDTTLQETARSWATCKLADHGVPWLRAALARPEMASGERRTALALTAPSTRPVWEALAEIDSALYEAFWGGVQPWRVPPEDVPAAAGELLRHGRPWTAVDLLASALHDQDGGRDAVTRELAESVLDASLRADPGEARSQSLGYEVGMLLDHLEGKGFPVEALAGYEFAFFRLLEDHRKPRALYSQLGANPDLFVRLVSTVYRGRNESRRQLEAHEEGLARHAWSILNDWRQLPGLRDDGQSIDAEHLAEWVRDARFALAETDREDIGDEQIGQVLSSSPTGADDIWPAEPVRDLVETIGSTNIETGIHVGVFNSRGVTSRGAFDGGQQERKLAARYRDWAQKTAGRWPRTSRLLRTLAETYESDAQHHDARAELTSDTE